MPAKTMEHIRLQEERSAHVPWKKWGPYVSERQWGTVREDYSENGDAWNYFSHDQARSRAYRRGEDGLGGICDDQQILCFALALWNGSDPILKERLFGLTNVEGNHGEDVKEYYFYLDSTPTHWYMKYLYKYPQRAYPYEQIVKTNKARTRVELEYELLDAGVFDDDRYFDIFVEYAKASAEDILIRITAENRGASVAGLTLLPTLWYRNTWHCEPGVARPSLRTNEAGCIEATHPILGEYRLFCQNAPELLFTENETNNERVFGIPNASRYVKDAFDNCIVHQQTGAVNPKQQGTKAAAHYRFTVPAQGAVTLRLRLRRGADVDLNLRDFDSTLEVRRNEADEFYQQIIPAAASEDEANVMRQTLAGMLWTKQHYVHDWMNMNGLSLFRWSILNSPRNKSSSFISPG